MIKSSNALPDFGFVRLPQIIGNPEATPPVPAVVPVCKTTWWSGIKKGIFPKPVKLSPRVAVWHVEDIRALINSVKGAKP